MEGTRMNSLNLADLDRLEERARRDSGLGLADVLSVLTELRGHLESEEVRDCIAHREYREELDMLRLIPERRLPEVVQVDERSATGDDAPESEDRTHSEQRE
jgi:hypothetical protein